MCSIISSLTPNSRSSSADDWLRSKSSARLSSQQSFGLLVSANEISVSSVLRRASSSTARSVQCAPLVAGAVRRGAARRLAIVAARPLILRCAQDKLPTIYDAAAEERHLFELQENIPGRLEALPLLRIRRDAREAGFAAAPVHAAEDARVGIAHRESPRAPRRARRSRTSSAATTRSTAAATATTGSARPRSAPATTTRSTPPGATTAAWSAATTATE